MEQIAGQFSLNDLLSESIKLGWIGEEKVGNIIPFQDLKNYKDKKVVYQSFMGSGDDSKPIYKVILIKDYLENTDKYYRNRQDGSIVNDYLASISSKEVKDNLEPEFTCDRLAYSDDNRTKKANSWISEAFCNNGRHQIAHNSFLVCFHELKAL